METISIKGAIVENGMEELYGYLGWDCACPRMIERALTHANGDDVVLEINSPGGYVSAGYEMYALIRQYTGNVTARVITACSAATLPMCAADRALISDAGYIMVHCASTSASGNRHDMERTAQALSAVDEGIINAYAEKTGRTREELQELMENETYMAPERAIDAGFIDGYIFPARKDLEKQTAEDRLKAVAAAAPVITPGKARELMRAVKALRKERAEEKPEVAPVQPKEPGESPVSDTKPKEGGKETMSLEELLNENPQASEELDALLREREQKAADAERERIRSIDAIRKTVTEEAANDAKYGENRMDGKTLAYEALAAGDKLAQAYADAAAADYEESGAANVGIGDPDAGEEVTDESDEMANYVNEKKGGMR